MKNDVQIKTVMNGALILTLSSLIAKALSAVYRIPLQNLVGNVGFYIYQQVYPIYGIGMTFALSGLPVLISKMVAEQSNLKQRIGLAKQVTFILSIIAVIIFLGLQNGATFLATQMGDVRLTSVIQAVSWMFLLMPFLSVTRGFFQGTLNMLPTAISQIVEQIIRVGIIIVVALLANHHHWDLYRMGKDAMLSSPISALFSSILLLVFALPLFRHASTQPLMNSWQLTKQIITEGGAICLLSALMLMMQLVDSFTIRKGLLAFGLNDIDSQNLKGVYDRAQPLVQLGLVVGTAFASAALPSLSKSVQANERKAFQNTAQLMMKSSLVVTSLVTVGMVILMPSINLVLFGNATGSLTIAVYCLSIIMVTLITTYNGILQSLGDFNTGLIAVIVSIVVKILTTSSLVERSGIIGGSLSTVIAVSMGLLVNWIVVRHKLAIKIYSFKFGWKLFVSLMGMSMSALFCQQLGALLLGTTDRLMVMIQLILAISGGAITGIILVLRLKLFSQAELKSLPIINRWSK